MRWTLKMTGFAGLTALASVLSLSPSAVQACSCAAGLTFSQPSYGAVDVPLNAQIQLGFSFTSSVSVELVSASGAKVPVETEQTLQGSDLIATMRLAPGSSLQAKTQYKVMSEGMAVLSFTTGSSTDTLPPTLAGIGSFAGGYDDGCTDGMCTSCGDSLQLQIEYAMPDDDKTPTEGLLYRVYIAKGGAIPDASSPSVLVTDYMSLGYSLCSTTYPDLVVGDTVTIRAATVDWAGQESALTGPMSTVVADDPDAQSPGCGNREATPRPVQGGLLVAGLGLAGLMVRRRRG